MADGDKEMNLRYAGTCAVCGMRLEQGERAVYNRVAKNVRHVTCPDIGLTPIDRGVAGGSARREYLRRQTRDVARHEAKVAESKANIQSVFGTGLIGKGATFLAVNGSPPRVRQSTKVWETGALGEEKVAARLDELAKIGVIALHDRRIPHTRANIDHLVVTPWGVWVIDSKRYVGKKIGVTGSFFGIGSRKQLLIGGRNKTGLVSGIEWQLSKVREVVGSDVRLTGCLCFVDAKWPLLLGSFSIRGVDVCWPKKLTKTLQRSEDAQLDPDAIARQLAAAFPAAAH